jgi:hypothetical protein
VKRLICACCGRYAGTWRQHWNQDAGYGVCAPCVKWMQGRGETDVRIVDVYGKEGINWGSTES